MLKKIRNKIHNDEIEEPITFPTATRTDFYKRFSGRKSIFNKKKNPTKTFIGGIVCTLIVIYIIFPFAVWATDTLLAYLMK